MNDLRSAPPRTAVPPGRLSWSKGATATVWTVQSGAVWDNLMMTGVHRVTDRPQLDEPFLEAYLWMRRRMRARLGRDVGTCWPVWGWARTTRRDLMPNPQRGANEVLLHLQVPRELVLASHFGGWHSVLNSAVLYPPELADEEDDTVYDAWQRTSDERVRALGGSLDMPVHQWPQAARAYAEGTWEAIFDVYAWSRTNALQCVMPRLDAAWVIDAVHILAPRRAARLKAQ